MNEFKKDNYIVITKSSFDLSDYSINYCYKQIENSESLISIDNTGNRNGYDACNYTNNKKINWRYATQQEIDEYDRLGKPYDITTLEKEFILPEKWYIKVTSENQEILNDWKQKVNPDSLNAKDCRYINCYGRGWRDVLGVRGMGREITFEQFKKYVLKDEINSKELTIDDLVEGEIYYGKILSSGNIIFIPKKYEIYSNDIFNPIHAFSKGNYPNMVCKIRNTTLEEKKWLNTCIKQNKFIPQSELDNYDDEGNLIEESKFEEGKWYYYEHGGYSGSKYYLKYSHTNKDFYYTEYINICDKNHTYQYSAISFECFCNNRLASIEEIQQYLPDDHPDKIMKDKPFEYNKWYKFKDIKSNFLAFIKSKTEYYGFHASTSEWVNVHNANFEDTSIYIEASDEEVKQRLLKYAKKHYSLNTKFKSAYNIYYGRDNTTSYNVDRKLQFKNDNIEVGNNGASVYYKGIWAEIVESNKESISKYSKGTWLVRKSNTCYDCNRDIKIGDITIITESTETKVQFETSDKYNYFNIGNAVSDDFKWFATYEEAEEYSNKLKSINQLPIYRDTNVNYFPKELIKLKTFNVPKI